MDKSIKRRRILFWILIIIAILTRTLFWPDALQEINCDEMMTAINAKSIADTGKDIYGTSFPVYAEAWQYTGQSVMLMYLMAIAIKILGATIVAIRLPMLIVSIITLFIMYDFTKLIQDKKIHPIGKFILSVWIGISVLLGCIIKNSNINKLNCIWYPMLILASYGIYQVCNSKMKKNIYRLLSSLYI